MKTSTFWRYSKSALLLITVLLFSNWSMAQVETRVSDPSENNPNYDSEKRERYSQVRSTNDNTSITENRSSSVEKPGSVASLNKATSACFIPLDASYTSIPRNDDGSFGPIALPFVFDLYGTSYTQVWINTNGNLTFTGPYSTYSASGFPFSTPMVAPFWGDVDTRNTAGGLIHYKLTSTSLVVTWDRVGYYNQAVDKLNEFQVVISDGFDPIVGLGQNVCFNYGDMQWTTGSASGGVGGFGGTPATVGSNKGNGIDYYQLGRFGNNTSAYDGPGGATDGVNYLDQQCYCAQTSSAQNIAPIASNFPSGVVNIACGETYNVDFSFIPPEVNQTVSTTVSVNGACGTTFTSTTGSISNISFSLLGQMCNEGTNIITFTGTDDGTPVESTTVTLTIVVGACCNLTASSTGQDESCSNQSDGSISVSTTGGTAPLEYSTDGGVTYSSSSNITGLATGTYVVLVKDANGCESTPQTITISGPTQLGSASSATSILCNGGTSNVIVSATGGTPPYSGTGNFTVSAGSHTYTVTDANGCTSVTTVIVAEPTQLGSASSATSILCNGGTSIVTVSATGGTSPYSGTGNFTVSAGSHTYTVTDANGCTSVTTVIVDEPTQMVSSATSTSISCFGGSSTITVSATGGTAPYSGTGNFTVSAGTYSYSVSDANGCTNTVTITVSEPTQLMASATSTQILCNGETTDITVT
ncbi:MAG: hypothetical protein HRT58_02550, partial [Crocinitomicaceae bacterium]|nr:hypothetical protein [Crocinitomicaceae bacterium]